MFTETQKVEVQWKKKNTLQTFFHFPIFSIQPNRKENNPFVLFLMKIFRRLREMELQTSMEEEKNKMIHQSWKQRASKNGFKKWDQNLRRRRRRRKDFEFICIQNFPEKSEVCAGHSDNSPKILSEARK
ncbi:hypothetical protein ACOSQ2_024189 [Xanthoceras sorbifolium]